MYPRLVVFKEKYGDSYYLVSSKESENKMFFDVLLERYNSKWYDWMKDYTDYSEDYKSIKDIIDNNKVSSAKFILSKLSDGEYEGFEFASYKTY